MLPRLAADALVALHFCFIVYVVAGGFLAWRWRWTVWLHVPVAVWGAFIEFSGRICPLTPLENRLRHLAGQAGYEGGFIEHYLIPVIYPSRLTTAVQVSLGVLVLLANAFAYAVYFRRRHPRIGGAPNGTN